MCSDDRRASWTYDSPETLRMQSLNNEKVGSRQRLPLADLPKAFVEVRVFQLDELHAQLWRIFLALDGQFLGESPESIKRKSLAEIKETLAKVEGMALPN